jgi:hypothetical protein
MNFLLIFVVQTYETYCPLTKKTGASRLMDALVAFSGEATVGELIANSGSVQRIEILPPQLLPPSCKVTMLLNIAPNLDDIVDSGHLEVVRLVSHQDNGDNTT